jgi:hypothetical protein
MKPSVIVETFEEANGFTARVKGDTGAKTFGNVQHFKTAAQASRATAADHLGFTYPPSAQEAHAVHIGKGDYKVTRRK